MNMNPVPERSGASDVLLRFVGSGLLVATGAIHLDLYLTGYRSIPTIGWLFLLQVATAFVLAATILATRWWLAALSGAGFAAATLGGYLLSVWVGLFGFKEVRTTAGIAAGVIEVLAFGALSFLVLRDKRLARARSALRPAAGCLLLASAALLGLASSASGTGAPAGNRAFLGTARIGSALVLTNTAGLTLYWFSADSATSHCYGECAAYWPPVLGTPVAPASQAIAGRLSTVRRTNGALQATYEGHPLYTYIGDSSRGSDRGNGLDLNGGIWHQVNLAG